MNMPLFVTDYLHEKEGHVGYLASLCAGLEVPFMVILGILSRNYQHEHYLYTAVYLEEHFTLVLAYLKIFI